MLLMLVLDPLTACESRLCWDQQWINSGTAAISDFSLARSGGRIMPGLILTFRGVRSGRDTILLLTGANGDEKTCKAAPGKQIFSTSLCSTTTPLN